MEKGEKKTKGGKFPLNTFGKLRPERKKFRTRPQQIMDPLEKTTV